MPKNCSFINKIKRVIIFLGTFVRQTYNNIPSYGLILKIFNIILNNMPYVS